MFGIVMFDIVFLCFVGDIGNFVIFFFLVCLCQVSWVLFWKVIFEWVSGMVDDFVDVVQFLQVDGCKVIVISCGFLVLYQQIIVVGLEILFVSFSLCWLFMLYYVFGGVCYVGILMVFGVSFGVVYLVVLGGSMELFIVGMLVEFEFVCVIVGNQFEGDMDCVYVEMVVVVDYLVVMQFQVCVILFECINMLLVVGFIVQCIGCLVFDLVGLVRQMMGLVF